MKKLFASIVFFAFLTICFSSCKESNIETSKNKELDKEPTLGEIQIDVTCSAGAKPVFHEGLLFLHSFQFKDAAEKFQEAQKIDPSCAMAYWGEAMSENHPLWREQDKDRALEILSALGDTKEEQREKFITDFEKDMFDAVSTLYGTGSKKQNDQGYAVFMEHLNNKYPNNHEVKAFYALSLLGAVEDDRDEDLYEKAAKIAKSIIAENPHHPGALHYLIHSYDDPKNAPKALDAANRYSKVAPDAAHALHMPSHIFVALGMWDEVISSNKAAVAASIKRQELKDLDFKAIDFHSLKWLMYGHLQKGEQNEARQLVEQMENYCEQEHTSKAVSHTVMMKAAYLTETNKWDDVLLQDEVDYSDLPIQIYGTRCFVLGMEAFHANDVDSLQQIISTMNPTITDAYNKAMAGATEMCSGSYDRSRPTKNHVSRTEVVQLQLKALLAMLNNNDDDVDKYMQQAIEKEETTTYLYGPPEIVKPTHEMYAEWLEKKGKVKEALKHYKEALVRAPGRYIPSQAIEKLSKAS